MKTDHMNFAKIIQLISIIASLLLCTCGAQIKTGRNSDPAKWPESAKTPVTEAPALGDDQGGTTSCFDVKARSIPQDIATFCADAIKPQAVFKELYPLLCEQGFLTGLLKTPSCGWDGTPSRIKSYIHHYYIQKDTTKDYEDINATITHTPVPLERFMRPVRLAFENYEQFKSEGYQWINGTREHKNLSGTNWEQGVNYRFRADKVEYEIGYQGTMKLYQLSPDLFAHINYATGDYARIADFAQIILYSRQADNTALTLKLEHRRVASQGLYDLAKRSAGELARDVMEKGYKNAIKP